MSKDKEKVAIVEKVLDKYIVKVYGTGVFSGRHQFTAECLAADINEAVRRHEAAKKKESPTAAKKRQRPGPGDDWFTSARTEKGAK